MQMLRAITQGGWGLPAVPQRAPRGYYPSLMKKLVDGGIQLTSTQDLSNAKGRKLLESALPITSRMLPLLSWFVRKYPTVDLALVFHPDEVDEAVLMIEKYNFKRTEKTVA